MSAITMESISPYNAPPYTAFNTTNNTDNMTTDYNQFYDSESILDKYSIEYTQYHGPLAVSVSVVGSICNILNILVLTRPSMITSTNTLLTWLAVADLLTQTDYILFACKFYIFNSISPLFYMRQKAWIGYLIFHINFSVVCHSWAIWITVALAVFRYIYIRFPTDVKVWCTIKRAKITVGLIFGLIVLVTIPNLVQHKIVFVKKCNTSSGCIPFDSYIVEYSDFIYNTTENGADHPLVKFNKYLSGICLKLVPCFALSIFTALLVLEMHAANKRSQKLLSLGRVDESHRHSETNRITGMLLAVVVLFLITELPQGIMFLLEPLNPAFGRAYNNLGDTFDLIALINNSINFMLYCTMSTQFRRLSYSLLCKPISRFSSNTNSNGFRPMMQVNNNIHVPLDKNQKPQLSAV